MKAVNPNDFYPEFYFWFLIPTLVAIFIMWRSIIISLKRKSVESWIFTSIIFVFLGLSEVILYQIFFLDSWPSFIPHGLILLSLILLGVQTITRKKKANAL